MKKKDTNFLKSLVREVLLSESAKKPEDFPDGLSIVVSPGVGMQKKAKYVWNGPGPSPVMGEIVWRESFRGPNEIIASKATRGWGPLLYDIAMELAGSKGLVPDQERVSTFASNVWSFYNFSRSDVESSNISIPGRSFGSPLSKSYKVKDLGTPNILKLKKMGKIEFIDPVEEEDI